MILILRCFCGMGPRPEPNCRKIDDGNSNNSANTEIYAYLETTFGWTTISYVMTENWIYGCCLV